MTDTGHLHLEQGQAAMARARLNAALGEPTLAEPLARGALADFAAAMNWLEDTPDFEVAHYRLDEAGRWVREMFGCWLTRDGTTYQRTCPADLGHIRLGMSPGMKNIVRVCSVCGMDPRLCPHIKGRVYQAPRMVVSERCNLCHAQSCDHEGGEMGDALCIHIIIKADIDEVSLVPRPANPDARILKISVSGRELSATLGPRGWQPGMDVSCDRCLTACGGVHDRRPEAEGG